MNKKIKINSRNSYKIGIDEIEGLKSAMIELMKPIESVIQDKAYWLRDNSILEESEYKSRDCFMAHSHNCGGIEIRQIIPECEQSEFDYLEFGEWDGTHYCDESDTDNCDCSYENDGHYDAKLRIWFKFEGYDSESGELSFYLYLGGGNGDAPYFRTHSEQTIFEASFTCKSVEGLKRSANKHFKDLLKIIK